MLASQFIRFGIRDDDTRAMCVYIQFIEIYSKVLHNKAISGPFKKYKEFWLQNILPCLINNANLVRRSWKNHAQVPVWLLFRVGNFMWFHRNSRCVLDHYISVSFFYILSCKRSLRSIFPSQVSLNVWHEFYFFLKIALKTIFKHWKKGDIWLTILKRNKKSLRTEFLWRWMLL